jgi:hypothetical protein
MAIPPNHHRKISPAIESHRRLLHWLVPTLANFPREQRFLLGDRMQSIAMDVLENLIEARFSRINAKLLKAANIGLEKLRHMLRLAFEFRYITMKKLEHASRLIDDVGRLIGGWLRAMKEKDTSIR